MAPPEADVPAATAAGGILGKKGLEHVTPRTLFNGVQGPFNAEVVNVVPAKASALHVNGLQGEGSDIHGPSDADPEKRQASSSGAQEKAKGVAKDAEEDGGYLSDDPDECQDPEAISDIATQAGFAITLLVPFKWHEEFPRTIDTVGELLRLWEGHMTGNAKVTTKFHKLTPAWLSKEHFGRLQVVFVNAADANFMWSRKVDHFTASNVRLTLGWQHPENQEYLKERSARPEAIEVLLKSVPAVISPEMVRKSLVTATLLKRKRTAFLEGSAFHRVVDPVTGSDTDKIKGLVFCHPGDKQWWLRVDRQKRLTSVLLPFRAAASLKLTPATKAIMEDPAMVLTSTNGVREEWLCVQEGCEKAHGVTFAQAAEHAASVRHCTERLKAGSATRQSKGKLNLLAVGKAFGM
ncbi:unnamed protein product [Closterium sp. Naga37s-1]|nr:unnamed protein product [Closterium sp. Naga37s-1]